MGDTGIRTHDLLHAKHMPDHGAMRRLGTRPRSLRLDDKNSICMRMPRVKLGSQAWEACMMPLHYMRREWCMGNNFNGPVTFTTALEIEHTGIGTYGFPHAERM